MTVEIRTGNRSYIVSSAADVTSALDELAMVITTPTLIELRAAETVLHIGPGHPLASVALFPDAKRQAFFAESANIDAAVPDGGEPSRSPLDQPTNRPRLLFLRRMVA